MIGHLMGKWVLQDVHRRVLPAMQLYRAVDAIVFVSVVFTAGVLYATNTPLFCVLSTVMILQRLYTSFYLTPKVRCKEYDMFPEDLPIPYIGEDEMTFKYQSIEELVKQCHKLIVTQLNSYTDSTLIMAPCSNVYTGSREDINRLHAKTSGNNIVSGFFIKTIDLAFVSIQSCASATAETMLHEMIHRYTSDEGLCSYLTYCIAGHLHQDVQFMALWNIVSHSDYDVYGTARKYFTPKQVSELRLWCAETMAKYKVGIQEGD